MIFRREAYGLKREELNNQEIFTVSLNEKLDKSKMTQRELSHLTGISEITISNYAKGKTMPKLANLVRITNALKCTPDDLLCP